MRYRKIMFPNSNNYLFDIMKIRTMEKLLIYENKMLETVLVSVGDKYLQRFFHSFLTVKA